ncbi:sensor histidine kinase [Jiulongibacter sediminis]|uniref:histidine kinase n=1 Tax=Jiulongibacter sediminis TaxID=1605367 RepID=A0A0P7C8Q0_9BACT|nr:HAMP domain-containing sensor histidine kinase [Jiulongibacter sediminis]KPM48897.1 histidine kinase [Jiulongibacter sediminis]TBX25426.1 histidine kinase [Jiulongibacter sediminis]
MYQNRLFFNLNQQLSRSRIIVITVLLTIGAGVLYYFNQLGQALEEREKTYAFLYAESIRFTIEQGINSPCDYTFVSEVVAANETIPTILVDQDGVALDQRNIPELSDTSKVLSAEEENAILQRKIEEMALEHEPIAISLNIDGSAENAENMYLYYSSSLTLKELRYFPYILLATFLIFGTLAFIAYSSSRRAEQNRVWVGLAKETAHQLGTPISGLLGWIGVMRSQPGFDQTIGDEMEKDVNRLETITTRFSNIGSVPAMKEENIGLVVKETIGYLERRISTKINWSFENTVSLDTMTSINRNLFEWVIENLCKNAVDAMAGVGSLQISVFPHQGKVGIDITDSGKGISKSNQRKIFDPGFSTKKRGWGLGLTLAKRIIETYHNGKLTIYHSEIGKGTTFRIVL